MLFLKLSRKLTHLFVLSLTLKTSFALAQTEGFWEDFVKGNSILVYLEDDSLFHLSKILQATLKKCHEHCGLNDRKEVTTPGIHDFSANSPIEAMLEEVLYNRLEGLYLDYLKLDFESTGLEDLPSFQFPQEINEFLRILTTQNEMCFSTGVSVYEYICEIVNSPVKRTAWNVLAEKCFMDSSLKQLFPSSTDQQDALQKFVKIFLTLPKWNVKIAANFALFLKKKGLSFEQMICVFESLQNLKISQEIFLVLFAEMDRLDQVTTFEWIQETLAAYFEIWSHVQRFNWHWLEAVSLLKIFSDIDLPVLSNLVKTFSHEEIANRSLFYEQINLNR
jgi:hypothetical protein